MDPRSTPIPGLASGIAFWAGVWQKQFEHNLTLMAAMAQALPHDNARALAADAESHKAKPKAPRNRSATS